MGAIVPNERPIVFVVDDDLAIREALQDLLASVGMDVRLFASTQDFMQAQRPDAPGCLVLDVRLPGASGLSFQEGLPRAGVDLPVIQALMGHDHVDSSAAYIHLAPAHVRAAYDAARDRQRAWQADR